MTPTPFLSVLMLAATVSIEAPPVDWVYSLADATERATTFDRPILVYCWAEGSDYCGKLWQETLSNDEAGTAMSQFVCYSARHGGDGVQEVFDKFGVATLPTLLFLTPEGEADDLIQGFIPVDEFRQELARIRAGDGTVHGLRETIERSDPGSDENIEARWALAGKIQALGDQERHDELMESIRTLDSKGKTLVGARVRMQDTLSLIFAMGGGGDGDGGGDGKIEETDAQRAARIRQWDLKPLYAHAQLVELDAARHEAWVQIGNMEMQRQDAQAAFDAFHQAWKTCPEDRIVDWSNTIARWIVEHGEERTSKEKKFALKLAESALTAMRKTVADRRAEASEHDLQQLRQSEAYCWNTVAWCQHLNGRTNKAVKAAKKAIELVENEHYVADLERFAQR